MRTSVCAALLALASAIGRGREGTYRLTQGGAAAPALAVNVTRWLVPYELTCANRFRVDPGLTLLSGGRPVGPGNDPLLAEATALLLPTAPPDAPPAALGGRAAYLNRTSDDLSMDPDPEAWRGFAPGGFNASGEDASSPCPRVPVTRVNDTRGIGLALRGPARATALQSCLRRVHLSLHLNADLLANQITAGVRLVQFAVQEAAAAGGSVPAGSGAEAVGYSSLDVQPPPPSSDACVDQPFGWTGGLGNGRPLSFGARNDSAVQYPPCRPWLLLAPSFRVTPPPPPRFYQEHSAIYAVVSFGGIRGPQGVLAPDQDVLSLLTPEEAAQAAGRARAVGPAGEQQLPPSAWEHSFARLRGAPANGSAPASPCPPLELAPLGGFWSQPRSGFVLRGVATPQFYADCIRRVAFRNQALFPCSPGDAACERAPSAGPSPPVGLLVPGQRIVSIEVQMDQIAGLSQSFGTGFGLTVRPAESGGDPAVNRPSNCPAAGQ